MTNSKLRFVFICGEHEFKGFEALYCNTFLENCRKNLNNPVVLSEEYESLNVEMRGHH